MHRPLQSTTLFPYTTLFRSQPTSRKRKAAPQGPETHAAPGEDDQQKLQTQEPSLPADPLAIPPVVRRRIGTEDRKSTRLNSSHVEISYAVFCLKKKNNQNTY